jgi:hypothetical protein
MLKMNEKIANFFKNALKTDEKILKSLKKIKLTYKTVKH